ncbi:MAG: hypothetical protein AB7S89_00250 [Candidatus Babeliales bacterium]
MHSVKIKVHAFFQENSIELILQQAVDARYKLYIAEDYEYFKPEKNSIISPRTATKTIFKIYQETNYGGPIIAKLDETEVLLSFNFENPYLIVKITLFSNDWEKEFPNGESQKDFARYISFLLKITQDFPISNLEIKYL